MFKPRRQLIRCFGFLLLTCLALQSCSGRSGGAARSTSNSGTNRARFSYEIDLQGEVAVLRLELEVIGTSGVTWGPGVTPDITGVISTGSYTVYTSGELRSSSAHYVFTGQNQFADFSETSTFERFRVQWVETPQGLMMVVNPFGPGPVVYECVLVSVEPL